MQYFRMNLSRLRKTVEEKLPDGQDIFGYKGVSKAVLLKAIDWAYEVSSEIEIQEDGQQLVILALKRLGSKTYSQLKEFLDGDLTSEQAVSSFDQFVDQLSTLVEKVRYTYLVVAAQCLREDGELAAVRSEIDELGKERDRYANILDDLAKKVDNARALGSGLETTKQQCNQVLQDMQAWQTECKVAFDEVAEVHGKIEGWDEEIQEYDDSYRNLSKQINVLQTEAKELREGLAIDVKKGQESKEHLNEYEQENKKLVEEIRQTLGDANRLGMGASFQQRKRELTRDQYVWQGVFIASILLVVVLSLCFVLPKVMSASFKWEQVIVRLAIVSPVVWLAWFAARQYGFTTRIKEDYSFKHAAAMAYEGHKKAAREVNAKLEAILLEFSLFNMAQNPIRLYGGKADCASPLEEITAAMSAKLPNLSRITYEHAGIGKVSAYMDEQKPNGDEEEDEDVS